MGKYIQIEFMKSIPTKIKKKKIDDTKPKQNNNSPPAWLSNKDIKPWK